MQEIYGLKSVLDIFTKQTSFFQDEMINEVCALTELD